MAYSLSRTCFSPTWDIIKELLGITNKIYIDTELHTSTKHFNFYIFAFYTPGCFVDMCSFVPFIHFHL